jgi:hypothetical protein
MEAVYRRYAIVRESDLRDAAAKLARLDLVAAVTATGTKNAPVGAVPNERVV